MRTSVLFSAATLACLAASGARAATIRCVYTEPFVNTALDSRAGAVTVTRFGEKAQRLRVSIRRSGGHLVVTNGARNFRQTMTKDGRGSDGMSDKVFPWSARLTMAGLGGPLHGGCR